jgi:hypothetical protein
MPARSVAEWVGFVASSGRGRPPDSGCRVDPITQAAPVASPQLLRHNGTVPGMAGLVVRIRSTSERGRRRDRADRESERGRLFG